jgi:hypothetical protein
MDEADRETEMIVSNEFADVMVRLDNSANGPRLMIKSARTQSAIYLDPLELERLSSLRHQDLAVFIDPSYSLNGSNGHGHS